MRANESQEHETIVASQYGDLRPSGASHVVLTFAAIASSSSSSSEINTSSVHFSCCIMDGNKWAKRESTCAVSMGAGGVCVVLVLVCVTPPRCARRGLINKSVPMGPEKPS